jgi:hypothetical protein
VFSLILTLKINPSHLRERNGGRNDLRFAIVGVARDPNRLALRNFDGVQLDKCADRFEQG